jgi:hypothetical protein
MFASGESEYRPQLVVDYSIGNDVQTMSGSSGGYDPTLTLNDGSGFDSFEDSLTTTTAATETSTDGTAVVESVEEVTLVADADASISNVRQSQNFGTQNAIVVDGGDYNTGMIRGANEESEQFDALIRFDTSSVNVQDVESVVLEIQVTKGCEYGGDVFVTDEKDWDQDSVTWGNAPKATGDSIGSLVKVETSQWYTVDLTASIDMLSGDSVTLRLSSPMNSRCMYTSMDRGDDTAPRLILEIRPMPQGAAAQTVITSLQQPTQDLIPVTGNFILIVATDDTTIDATSPNSGKGDAAYLYVDYDERSRVIRDTLIRFDLSQMHGGVLPQSALLTLFTESPCENAGTFMTTEGSGEWNEKEVTWTTAPNYNDNNSYEGGKMIGTFGTVQSERWYGFSVVEALTEAVLTRKEAITFRLTSGAMKSCSYSSIQSGRPPKLLVAF